MHDLIAFDSIKEGSPSARADLQGALQHRQICTVMEIAHIIAISGCSPNHRIISLTFVMQCKTLFYIESRRIFLALPVMNDSSIGTKG